MTNGTESISLNPHPTLSPPPTPHICLFAVEMLNLSHRCSHSDEEPSSDDDDDALSEILSTISLSESITDYVYENGRRYHSYPHALYAFPNDEQEQDRLDLMHHLWNLALGGELFLAPIEHSKIKRVCVILYQEAIDRLGVFGIPLPWKDEGGGVRTWCESRKKTSPRILETADSVDTFDSSAYSCFKTCPNCVGAVDSRFRDWNWYASIKSALGRRCALRNCFETS